MKHLIILLVLLLSLPGATNEAAAASGSSADATIVVSCGPQAQAEQLAALSLDSVVLTVMVEGAGCPEGTERECAACCPESGCAPPAVCCDVTCICWCV